MCNLQELIQATIPHDSTLCVVGTVEPARVILRLTGPLDLESSRALQNLLVELSESCHRGLDVVIDLFNVDYISSTGVGALTSGMAAIRKHDAMMTLRGIQPKVRAVLELLGILSFFREEVDGQTH